MPISTHPLARCPVTSGPERFLDAAIHSCERQAGLLCGHSCRSSCARAEVEIAAAEAAEEAKAAEKEKARLPFSCKREDIKYFLQYYKALTSIAVPSNLFYN